MKQGRRVYVGADFESDPRLVTQLFPPRSSVVERVPAHIVGAYGVPEGAAEDVEVFDEFLPLTGDSGQAIAAGAIADFELKPNRLFTPGPLSIPDAVAANLIMTSLAIGGSPIFVRNGAIPCSVFSEKSFYKHLASRTASNSSPITFTLKNIHASVSQTVYGCWFGRAVKA